MSKTTLTWSSICQRAFISGILAATCLGFGAAPSAAAVSGFYDGQDYSEPLANLPTDISFKNGNNKLPDVPLPGTTPHDCTGVLPCFRSVLVPLTGSHYTELLLEVPAADDGWTTWAFSFTDKTGAVTYGSYHDQQHGYVATAPEPSTWAMGIIAFAALGGLALRMDHRKRNAPAMSEAV
jgi:hypothetical protein